MTLSRKLPTHLREALGTDAGEELMMLVEEMRAEHAGFRREFQAFAARVDERFDRMDTRFTALEARVADVKSDLMKWSFVFWCGSVTAIAMLARVLEH